MTAIDAWLPSGTECLYDLSDLNVALDRLANDINQIMPSDDVLLALPVMNGGLITAGHLLPRLQGAVETDYVHATRYGKAMEGQTRLRWLHRPETLLHDRHLLIIDDILDQGLTLKALVEDALAQGARSVHTVAMVQKRLPEPPAIEADFVGLTVPDRFVFGFGMDWKGLWRNAPGIFAVPD
ncbi:hypoxanthine-guanine phosphoribosyltransferase [Marinimicrobium sp. ARAG 43.8]|uniref:hypoxanthine-guanine phosphoribosyltransferase n=1 Tax=Marinimicrobium sp. ARAG 43.8 TaxID=3418719 RepID=UPI003CEF76EB